MKNSGDELRAPENAFSPDPRSAPAGRQSIEDQYQRIKDITLADCVPEEIAIQFEVARNLYLYAFNVYRFYMVAKLQVLVTLEFAIKTRFGKGRIRRYGEKIKKGGGLSGCLHYVFDKGFCANEDFPAWNRRRRVAVEYMYMMDKSREMDEKQLDSIVVDYDEIDYDRYPFDYDYLAVLKDVLPEIRNMHAHGTRTLDNMVLGVFENVAVIIDKIYDPALELDAQ